MVLGVDIWGDNLRSPVQSDLYWKCYLASVRALTLGIAKTLQTETYVISIGSTHAESKVIEHAELCCALT
jgi:hypothetical protein